MSKPVSAYNKKPGEKVFYCPRRNHHFSVPRIGQDGKPIQQTNPMTGVPLTDISGNPQYASDMISFTEHQPRLSEDGYWCKKVTNKDTPKHIVDFLNKCAADRGSEIVDEDTFLNMVNPDLALRVKTDKAKDDKIASQEAEIAELRAKLQGNQQRRN